MLLAAETASLVVPIRGYLPALRESVGVKSGEFKAHTHDREHLYNALHLNGEMNGKGRKTRRLRQMGGLCELTCHFFNGCLTVERARPQRAEFLDPTERERIVIP